MGWLSGQIDDRGLSRQRLFIGLYWIMPVTPQLPCPATLNQQELRAIGQAISRDFAPRFFQARGDQAQPSLFSTQELREIARQISLEYSRSSSSRAAQLLLLPVAPGRLHVFWQVDKTVVPKLSRVDQIASAAQADSGLHLRLYPVTDQQPDNGLVFTDLPVASEHGHAELQVTFNTDQPGTTGYRAELGLIDQQERFSPLLASNAALPATPARDQTQHAGTPAIQQSIMAFELSTSSAANSHSGQGKHHPHE